MKSATDLSGFALNVLEVGMQDSSRSPEIAAICLDYGYALEKVPTNDVDPAQTAMRLTEMAAQMRARRRILGFFRKLF